MNPTPENPDPVNNDLHDRLVDRALAEVMGGETPPDLSAHILKSRQVTNDAKRPAKPARRTRLSWLTLGVAATLLVGATLLLLSAPQAVRENARGTAKLNRTRIQVAAPVSDWVKSESAEAPVAIRTSQTPKSGVAKSLRAREVEASQEQAHRYALTQSPGLPGLINDAHAPYARALVENQTTKIEQILAEGRGQALAHDARVNVNAFGRDSIKQQAATDHGIGPGFSGDQYTRIFENPFIKAEGGAAVSTFSIDVDTASYANVRQFLLRMNTLPPPDAVRIEELVNYFDYDYAGPQDTDGAVKGESVEGEKAEPIPPFAAHLDVAGCPWKSEHRLVRIAIKGREIDVKKRPLSNLVFLIDVSGSMNQPDKLPLVVYGLQQLARELGENDRVAIVVYASSESLVLPSTPGNERETILSALGTLQAGGSTAGGAGIQLAYQIAEDNFIKGGTNRVILSTDGDFNVGVTSTAELERFCEQKAKDTGVFLSVLGFGRGNLNDAMMEAISNRGNGNYSYVDGRSEARRVLVEEMGGTLVTIAKDVKIQVEFNPRQVAGYRLIGYENRLLRTEDFNDDTKDAGEIGAGHAVTALYEVVPAGQRVDVAPVDGLKYQPGDSPAIPNANRSGEAEDAANVAGELLTLKMRYKEPEGDKSRLIDWAVTDSGKGFGEADDDFQFAAAAAGFGLLLRNSEFKGNLTYGALNEIAHGAMGDDRDGYRAEFIEMVDRARRLTE